MFSSTKKRFRTNTTKKSLVSNTKVEPFTGAMRLTEESIAKPFVQLEQQIKDINKR
jgi:hypothetical protein